MMEYCVDGIKKHSAVVFGPGLGRENNFLLQLLDTLVEKDLKNKILLFDADSLWTIFSCYRKPSEEVKKEVESRIKSLSKENTIILTPNTIECTRLLNSLTLRESMFNPNEISEIGKIAANSLSKDEILAEVFTQDCPEIANYLKKISQDLKIYILLKGEVDLVFGEGKIHASAYPCSKKRSGGQGDILSGLTCLYSDWAFKTDQKEIIKGLLLGSSLARIASFRAYEKFRFSFTAVNMIDELHNVVVEFLE